LWVARAGDDPTFYAQGLGAQRIDVIPDLGLVVVVSREFDATHEGVDGEYLDYLALGHCTHPAMRAYQQPTTRHFSQARRLPFPDRWSGDDDVDQATGSGGPAAEVEALPWVRS
jgi:hypothetical protein